jgi:hypothetical protein
MPPDPRKRRDFLTGMGIVAVPVALSLIAGGLLASAPGFNQVSGTGITLGILSGGLYVLLLVVMLILFLIRGARQVALGMLAAAAIGPVVSSSAAWSSRVSRIPSSGRRGNRHG